MSETLKRENAFCGQPVDDYAKLLLELNFTEDELNRLNKVFDLIEKYGTMDKCCQKAEKDQHDCEKRLFESCTVLKPNSDLIKKYENDLKNAVKRTEEVWDLCIWFSYIGSPPIDYEALD